MVSGEDLQWGKVCNGFSIPLQIFREVRSAMGGGGLQYNTGMVSNFSKKTNDEHLF